MGVCEVALPRFLATAGRLGGCRRREHDQTDRQFQPIRLASQVLLLALAMSAIHHAISARLESSMTNGAAALWLMPTTLPAAQKCWFKLCLTGLLSTLAASLTHSLGG